MRLIDANEAIKIINHAAEVCNSGFTRNILEFVAVRVEAIKTIEADPVKHGRWILEAHNERVNYRWNVTAECSECCDEKKEIWAGFFPGVPDSMAREAAVISAESVTLSNYCPTCGAKMDGGAENAK